jgi:hypothetical protein
MTDKRKISYEQDKALARGRDVARANQRRRVAANQAADKAREERERTRREHAERGVHGWKNWEYDFETMTETRVCRECGLSESRPIKW